MAAPLGLPPPPPPPPPLAPPELAMSDHTRAAASSFGLVASHQPDFTLGCFGRMKLNAQDLREIKLLKYYRLVRKWACKTNNILDADLELLIYLDCKGKFTRNDFINGVYIYSWDKNRWERLRRDGWIEAWRHRNRTTIKYSIFKRIN